MVMKLITSTRLERNVRRAGQIISVLVKYSLADWVKGLNFPGIRNRIKSCDGRRIFDLTIGQRIRLAFTELGATFIKLGQMLSTRPDLVGPDMARELADLQIAVPADTPDKVRATIEAEFGKPLSTLFAQFSDEPLASASIAQAHLARLHSGEEVVVKVQHDAIAEKFSRDLDVLADLAHWVENHVPRIRRYQPTAVVQQFRQMLLRELDFTCECRNLEEFRRNFARDDAVYFPRPYAEYSGRRVLTMERLKGILGSDSAALLASGDDLTEFARRGTNAYLQMIFRDAFYHADPHPGNVMLLPGCVFGMVDCGMTGRLDEELAENLDEMITAMVNRQAGDLTNAILRLGSAPPATPRKQLCADLADFVADFAGHSIQDMDLGRAFMALFAIVRRHGILLPPSLSLLLRTVAELEGTGQRFSPEFSLAEAFRPFHDKMASQRFSARRIVNRLRHVYRDWERLARSLPRDVDDVLRGVREGTFSVHLEHRHLDPATNRLVLGLLAAALLVSSALLWSMRAAPLISGISLFGGAGYAVGACLTCACCGPSKRQATSLTRNECLL